MVELSEKERGWIHRNAGYLKPLLEIDGSFLWREISLSNSLLRKAKENLAIKPAGTESFDGTGIKRWKLTEPAREIIEEFEPEQTLPCDCHYHVNSTEEGIKCEVCGEIHTKAEVEKHLLSDGKEAVADGGAKNGGSGDGR
ncbi:hypothetical protein [Halorhabdus rudnickae]|uniref:hypothetical protein n=1 Tax=Halorhabdus rudnickae TaxID=1775544 RepID=UPI00108470D9|nr:hypothetical protein [Halorhabdus rudnickae]